MDIIELNNIRKFYTKSKNPVKKLGGALGRIGPKDGFAALDGISLKIKKGECVGIIGRNGSGKSTLLRILSGITAIDSGNIRLRGTVSAMPEPGVGFNPEYSGMRNIHISGELAGLDRAAIKRDAPKIMEFAEIPIEFHNMPLKTYSAGMVMRLGFSVMLWQDADIILADEALGVGDIRFRAKCFGRFESLKNEGKTVIFVSHDPDAVRRFCTRAVWLDEGKVRDEGDVARVTSKYMEFCVQPRIGSLSEKRNINRYGTAVGSVIDIDATENAQIGDKCRIALSLKSPDGFAPQTASVSVSIKDRYGLDLCVFRTREPIKAGKSRIEFEFENRLAPGDYTISVAFENRSANPISYYEYIEGAADFRSLPSGADEVFGLVNLPVEIKMN